MPVRLARARVLAAVKEGEEPLAVVRVGLDAFQGRGEVVGLENMRLLFVLRRREDEVLADDWEFVQHEIVARAQVGDEEILGRMRERIDALAGGIALWFFGLVG